jgi:phosphoribosylanthranilate isomerase
VGVFVDELENSICDTADKVGLTSVQLHGDDQDPYVADLVLKRLARLKVLVGISMLHFRPDGYATRWSVDRGFSFLLDTGGGTGQAFDWEKERRTIEIIKHLGSVIVAGGLNPINVADAMRILHPWGVDVASGVEASPGKKDPEKVRAFVAAVREADKVH